jgi:hypothetical protein
MAEGRACIDAERAALRYGAADYAERAGPPLEGAAVDALWDAALSRRMARHGRADGPGLSTGLRAARCGSVARSFDGLPGGWSMTMESAMRRTALLLGAALLAACSGDGNDTGAPPAPPLSKDCTASACPALSIAGDPPATLPGGGASPVQGYADPSLRRDPGSAAIWLGYSWLHPDLNRQGTVRGVLVDTHLARSDDGGNSWNFVGAPWTAQAGTRDGLGRSGHSNSETVALAPGQTASGTRWYASRLVYFTPDGGVPQPNSFTIHVAAAAAPDQLGAAEEAVLGGDLTVAYWNVDLNLASLSAELSGCTFYDAGLLYMGDRLYLASQCALYGGSGEDTAHEFIALFATRPDGAPRSWNWSYLGRLASSADASALVPAAQMLQQAELALARDGTVLLIVSPSAPSGGTLTLHYGCYALAVDALDQAQLARDSSGAPLLRAYVTASDLTAPDGTTASCGYDAASASGIVIARRQQTQGLSSTLNRSGLQP